MKHTGDIEKTMAKLKSNANLAPIYTKAALAMMIDNRQDYSIVSMALVLIGEIEALKQDLNKANEAHEKLRVSYIAMVADLPNKGARWQ